jgi:hypothetical protein
MRYQGSTQAEINHSSNVAYFGNCNNWTVMKQLNDMLKRQQNHEKQSKVAKEALYVLGYNFSSKESSQQIANDQKIARTTLSDFCYKKCYTNANYHTKHLQIERLDNGDSHIWAANGDKEESNVHVILKDGRCNCKDVLDRKYQCGHELLNDGKLMISKYDSHWHNESYFISTNGQLYQSIFKNTNVRVSIGTADIIHTSDSPNDFDNSNGEDMAYAFDYHDELELSQGEPVLTSGTNTTFGDLLTKAKELVSVVQNDQKLRQSMFTSMSEWIQLLRKDSNIEVQFVNTILPTIRNSNSVISNIPIPAVTNPVKTACTMKRKRSLVEFRRLGRGRGNGNKHILRNRSVTHNNSRDCRLCHSKGHGKNSCPCLLIYGNPLPSCNLGSRQQLVMQLSDIDSFQTIYRDDNDTRTILLNMQAVIPALIIHRRMVIDKNIAKPISTYNFCCECTLLMDGGSPNESQKKVLYHVKDINTYLTRNQDNLIVCQCKNA